MRKLTLLFAFIASIFSLNLYAQDEPVANPNRVLVVDNLGYYKAFMVDRVQQVMFKRVEGEVSATPVINSFNDSTKVLNLSITRSEACQGFKLGCIPAYVADQLTSDEQMVNYICRGNDNIYYQDFESAELSGVDFEAGASYAVITVGMDTWGVECTPKRADFTVPKPAVVGNPQVECTFSDITKHEFTCNFVPNEDVGSYWYCSFEEGTAEQQFNMFGAWMGFTTMNDMIKSWGIQKEGKSSYTYTSMDPGKHYQIYVASTDLADNDAPLQVFDVTTEGLGGPGEATVSIEFGEFKNQDWNGEQKPSQFVTYTPNDQASCYRFELYKAADYDANPEACASGVQMDPPMPNMAYWFFYEPTTTDYQIDPNTEVVAVASAKNINGEWGPLTIVRYTTPDAVSEARSGKITPRIKAKRMGNRLGMAPVMPIRKSGLQLK